MRRQPQIIKGKYIVWFGLPTLIVVVFCLVQMSVYMTKARPPKFDEVPVAEPAPASPVAPGQTVEEPPVLSPGGSQPNTPALTTAARMEIAEPGLSDYRGSSWNLPLSEEGWSQFALPADSNAVYVSSSTGSDEGIGREEAPVRTLRRGVELLRKDRGDRLLLKRGDSWDEIFGKWTKSGESREFPMIVGSYGTGPRPRIVSGDKNGMAIQTKPGAGVKYLVVKELDFVAARTAPDREGVGISCLGETESLLVEDCRFMEYAGGMVFQAFRGAAISNVTLRRCIVLDSHNSKSHSQGLFCSGLEGLTIEECVFDHNGWSETRPGAVQTIFNHNVYIQAGGKDVLFRNNISARASSHGIQLRCGGLVADNLFFECPLAILLGGGDAPLPGHISGRVSGNVILEGNDIGDAPRGNAIEANNLDAGKVSVIADNIASRVRSKRDGFGVILDSLPGRNGYAGIHNLIVRDNMFYDWGLPLRLVGTEFSRVLVKANCFAVTNGKSPLVEFHLAEWTAPDKVEFSSNRYASNVPDKSSWFAGLPPDKKGAWRANFDEWTGKTGETGAVVEPAYADPGRSLETYAQSIGESADGFIETIRNRNAGTWTKAHGASAVIAYVREGFVAKTN